MAADGAGRGAGRIDQHAVERAVAAGPFGAIGDDVVGLQRQPRKIVAQPRHPRRRTIDRGDARAGLRELRGLAAGRGAEIDDGLVR